jgi:hypothetical protein
MGDISHGGGGGERKETRDIETEAGMGNGNYVKNLGLLEERVQVLESQMAKQQQSQSLGQVVEKCGWLEEQLETLREEVDGKLAEFAKGKF